MTRRRWLGLVFLVAYGVVVAVAIGYTVRRRPEDLPFVLFVLASGWFLTWMRSGERGGLMAFILRTRPKDLEKH